MTTMEDGAYCTTDMTFATVLIMHGFNPVMERLNETKVCWVIESDDWDERIEDLEDDYKRGACLVEPLRFMREIRDVRQRMYSILGIGDLPKGSRIRRAPSS
jgi:hypothetical protein